MLEKPLMNRLPANYLRRRVTEVNKFTWIGSKVFGLDGSSVNIHFGTIKLAGNIKN